MTKTVRLTESELRSAIKESVHRIIRESNNTFWGQELSGTTAAAGHLSRGVAQGFIQKNGEPKTIEAVADYIDPNRNNGFGFYTKNMFRSKTGINTNVGIMKNGTLCCYINIHTVKGPATKYLSVIKYDFNKPLITNLRLLYDKTPAHVDLTKL